MSISFSWKVKDIRPSVQKKKTNIALSARRTRSVQLWNLHEWLKNYLGPIAKLQLGACLCHSEATACLHSPFIIACIVYTSHYMISNKDTSWAEPTTTQLIYLYTDTWWQHWTCSSCSKKKTKTSQREREEEQSRYPSMFTAGIIAPRVRPAISGSSCTKLVHTKAQESQGSGRGLWTHRNQTTLFSGSMF